MNPTSHLAHTQIRHFAGIVSIVFPAIMHFTLGPSIKDSLLLKFITVLLPFSYSAAQHFLLFRINRSLDYKSSSLLHSILYFLLNLFLFVFAVIDGISTVTFTLDKWDDDVSFSILLPSFVVPSTYLLSTACILTPGSIQFPDTGFNFLIDILILLRIVVGIMFPLHNSSYIYIAVPSFILILLRSLNLGYSSSSVTEYAVWRQLIVFLIFGISLFIHTIIACMSISICINI
ncbi:hypothetical protein EROM_050010 [Encephalitozoon romaleae SJ-2008]|uniref:Uncharacterized protein n=1 Tax=Encephalitozoon romaleae (strain SJ-2008) TaxID=1178016 RepID=I7AE74_ENCRO|nr:hypothetical protein EROM_050010 [Encephalitozoon romaleae SJ-2008]AFN82935.1 hypothetical protein EROM_050010 [Encephalitozoon romaleae SJ-2008]